MWNLHLCYILSDKKLYPWYYQHYIQICLLPEGFLNYSEFGDDIVCEIIQQSETLSYESLKNNFNIIEYVCNKINQGHYLILVLDEFYLPQKISYKKEHFVHFSLVYGYDNQNEKILTIGFNEKRSICKIKYDYRDFFIAFEKGKLYYMNGHSDEENVIYTYKLKNFETEYPFSIKLFLDELHKYIFSEYDYIKAFSLQYAHRNIIKFDVKDVKFGFEIYDSLVKLIREPKGGNCSIDYRRFHFLWEHKKGIYNRLNYVISKFNLSGKPVELLNEYKLVVANAKLLKNIFMKNALSDDGFFIMEYKKSIINKLINIINDIKNEESRILIDIYIELKYNYFSRPEIITQTNLSDIAQKTKSDIHDNMVNSIYRNSVNVKKCKDQFESPWLKLEWENQIIVDKIRLIDKRSNSNWNLLGKLIFSDGSYVHISDKSSLIGPIKDISFSPKRIKWLKFEIIEIQGGDLDLIEIQTFKIV